MRNQDNCICFSRIFNQHDELEAKFLEKAALEAKYQKLYEPLNTEIDR